MSQSRLPATPLILLTAFIAGCGGDSSGPGARVPTTLEVTPPTASLFSSAPGNTIQVTAVTRDQDGAVMADPGPIDFSSSDEAVATVTPDGTITGVGAGSAQITASLTADEVTLSDATAVTVEDVPEKADVTAPAFDFEPPVVDVRAGGTVTWTFSNLAHTVTFVTAGAPENVPELQGGSESRTFPSAGVFDYQCDLHAEMTGTVRVH